MKKLIENLRLAIRDPVVTKQLYLITLAAALLVLVLVIKGPEQKGKLVVDSEGNVTSIQRHSVGNIEKYDLELVVDEGSGRIEKEIELTIQGTAGQNGANGGISAVSEDEKRQAEIDAQIDSIVADIEYSRDTEIILPLELSDGVHPANTRPSPF